MLAEFNPKLIHFTKRCGLLHYFTLTFQYFYTDISVISVTFRNSDDCVSDAGLTTQQFFVQFLEALVRAKTTLLILPKHVAHSHPLFGWNISLEVIILSFTFHLAELPAGPVERGEQVAGGDRGQADWVHRYHGEVWTSKIFSASFSFGNIMGSTPTQL